MLSGKPFLITSRAVSNFVFGTVIALTASSNAVAQSPQALTKIEQLYSEGSYTEALSLINTQMKNYVMNSNLHYLKANILAAQGELSQAAVEYENALHYNPSPGVKAYCEQALVAIQSPGSTTQRAPQQVSPQAAKPNTDAIDRQARHEVRRTQKQAAAAGSQVAAEAAEYQMHHAARTSSIVNNMQSAGFYDHDGDWRPMYGPADIAAVQTKRQVRENSVINGYAQARQNNQAASDQRSSAVLDAAEGLKSQMAVPVRRGEAALDPGTSNLFIRNYEPTSPPPPATALQSQPL